MKEGAGAFAVGAASLSRSRYGRNARSGIGSAPSFATRTAAGIYAESTGSTAYTAT